MRTLIAERRHEEYLEQRKKEKEPLPMALRELRNSYNPIREEGMGLCSSEEELNKLVSMICFIIFFVLHCLFSGIFDALVSLE
ncbi:hypothetical protein QJS04_geneDACA008351 [Acorus gramineus]|uniref:Uncharacterized protein n=1 Tax=Acorus gramineus TaxID=55184 RepID=A0AAV9B0E5_ACOGR|nr:hypothetical protein QJS04_geneDACA008351 [Acorus gramineus]